MIMPSEKIWHDVTLYKFWRQKLNLNIKNLIWKN